MADKIHLVANGDGTYREVNVIPQPGDPFVTWVKDSYTEPRDTLFDCTVCEQQITDWDLYTCLDGGDAAHLGCVEVTRGQVSG